MLKVFYFNCPCLYSAVLLTFCVFVCIVTISRCRFGLELHNFFLFEKLILHTSCFCLLFLPTGLSLLIGWFESGLNLVLKVHFRSRAFIVNLNFQSCGVISVLLTKSNTSVLPVLIYSVMFASSFYQEHVDDFWLQPMAVAWSFFSLSLFTSRAIRSSS